MARARIYDAAFAIASKKSHHSHLAKFWWITETGQQGDWTRQQAYAYVKAHRGDVFVRQGNAEIQVRAYHNDRGEEWIQTIADRVKKDNLMVLAQRHEQGLPNQV